MLEERGLAVARGLEREVLDVEIRQDLIRRAFPILGMAAANGIAYFK